MLNKHAHLVSKKQSKKIFEWQLQIQKKVVLLQPQKRAQVVELVDTLL